MWVFAVLQLSQKGLHCFIVMLGSRTIPVPGFLSSATSRHAELPGRQDEDIKICKRQNSCFYFPFWWHLPEKASCQKEIELTTKCLSTVVTSSHHISPGCCTSERGTTSFGSGPGPSLVHVQTWMAHTQWCLFNFLSDKEKAQEIRSRCNLGRVRGNHIGLRKCNFPPTFSTGTS